MEHSLKHINQRYEGQTDLGNPFFSQAEFTHLSEFKDVEIFQCGFNVKSYHDDIFQQNAILYPDSLSGAVNKRKSEFLAGRFCAKKVLKKLNISTLNVPFGQQRQPIWPDSVLGSISHTDNKAICAATVSDKIDYLGIDIEKWFSIKTVEDVRKQVINDKEEQLLKRQQLTLSKLLTIIFSAKESLYKALFPSVEVFFGFEAAQVTKIDLKAGYLELMLCETLSAQMHAAKRFVCYFKCFDGHVLTVVSGMN